MATRLHDRSSFFKYTSLDTARRVIESKRFRWSAPTLFNDPFDHQLGFVLQESSEALASELYESVRRLIYGDTAPAGVATTTFSALAMQLRARREGIPQDVVLGGMQQAAFESAQNLQGLLAELNATLREQLCRSRVFCVTEAPDNVVMWSHYADEHRGVVFELGCIDELDNVLLAAKAVRYTDRFLTFPSAATYAKHLTGEEPLDLLPLVWEIAYTKHTDWAYEREWRVHVPVDAPEGYSLFREPVSVFRRAILGCRTSDADAADFAALAREHLPGMAIQRARLSTTSFQLSFEPL